MSSIRHHTVFDGRWVGNARPRAGRARSPDDDHWIEDVAELGRDLERAALKAGYGSTVSAASVEKLVAAISDYQVESLHMIADLRKESEENAREIRRVVEQGKQQYQRTLAKFAIDGFIAAPQAEPVAIEASE